MNMQYIFTYIVSTDAQSNPGNRLDNERPHFVDEKMKVLRLIGFLKMIQPEIGSRKLNLNIMDLLILLQTREFSERQKQHQSKFAGKLFKEAWAIESFSSCLSEFKEGKQIYGKLNISCFSNRCISFRLNSSQVELYLFSHVVWKRSTHWSPCVACTPIPRDVGAHWNICSSYKVVYSVFILMANCWSRLQCSALILEIPSNNNNTNAGFFFFSFWFLV